MKRILIVDDEPHMTRVLKLYLERAGYEVQTAANGQIAIDTIGHSAPDALITDIQMPVMTGQALCQKLEEIMPERDFPIFVMTSMTDREHREWTQKINNLEFLEKPLSMRAVTSKLDQCFRKAETTEEINNG